ncbi:hypothetical protein MRX96_052135 [Rhipicephalus microplus]
MRVPSEDRRPSVATTSPGAMLPTPGFIFPLPPPFSRECATPLCQSVATQIRQHLDYTIDPCKDFYQYVCGKFRGQDVFTHVSLTPSSVCGMLQLCHLLQK